MPVPIRTRHRYEEGVEIVCRGVSRDTFVELLDDIRGLKPRPQISIKNPDPLTFTADTLHVLRVIFESHAGKALAVYAGKKGIDLLYEFAKARFVQTPKADHPQSIDIYGSNGKRTTRKR